MNWSELDDSDPITGDVDVVRRVADEFAQVGDEAETLTRRLRSLGDSSGPTIWRGEAADVFRRLLAETAPDLVKLSTNHDAGAGALRRYATSLDDAQDDGRRALDDGARAEADKDDAEARRNRARSDADGAASTARSADVQLRTAQAQRLLAVDPAYQTQLLQYEARVTAQRDQARSHETDARRRQSSAQSDADHAGMRLAAAKRLAGQAAQLRDSAARIAARELDDASDAAVDRRNVFRKLWDGAAHAIHTVDNALDRITASPAFASWMNVLSDIGDVTGGIGFLLAVVPFPPVQALGAALVATGAAFKGAAFLGTLVASRYGNASGSQVLGRGLDFGLAVIPGGKAGSFVARSGARLGAKLPPGVIKTAGKALRPTLKALRPVTKNLHLTGDYALKDARGLGQLDKQIAKTLHLKPSAYFSIAEKGDKVLDRTARGLQATAGGLNLSADLGRFGDPEQRGRLGQVAPQAAGGLVKDVGTLLRAPAAGKVLGSGLDVLVEGHEADEGLHEAREVHR